MLWWHEWVDQGDHWQPYQAIRSFIIGEDLRGGHSLDCVVTGGEGGSGGTGDLAARAWIQTTRILAYVIDLDWNRDGGSPLKQNHVQVAIPEMPAGKWQGQWWDADRGIPGSVFSSVHSGGRCLLHVPEFSGHVALKMWQ